MVLFCLTIEDNIILPTIITRLTITCCFELIIKNTFSNTHPENNENNYTTLASSTYHASVPSIRRNVQHTTLVNDENRLFAYDFYNQMRILFATDFYLPRYLLCPQFCTFLYFDEKFKPIFIALIEACSYFAV